MSNGTSLRTGIAKCTKCPNDIAIPIVYYNQPITIPFGPIRDEVPEGIDVPASVTSTFTDPNASPPLSISQTTSNFVKVLGLGHAGIAIINGKNGEARYYEYGRYDPQNYGLAREVQSINRITIVFDENGNPLQETMLSLTRALTVTNRGPYEFEAVYIKLANGAFDTMKEFIQERVQEISSRAAKKYDVANNHCFTFAMEVASEAGVNTDVSAAEDLDVVWVGSMSAKIAVRLLAPSFEVPSRQMRTLQNRYRSLNVNSDGTIRGNFEFPANVNSR